MIDILTVNETVLQPQSDNNVNNRMGMDEKTQYINIHGSATTEVHKAALACEMAQKIASTKKKLKYITHLHRRA